MNHFQPTSGTLLRHMGQSLSRIVDDIGTLVECESPSDDLAAIAASADVVAGLGASYLGTEPERIMIDGCTHLRWRLGDDRGPRVLLLGHHDTVWPIGTLARLPFSATNGVLRGPGSLDMKAGLVMAFHAIKRLDHEANITVLITGDEEIGSPTSRQLIETEARASSAALVLESASDGNEVKIARKGAATYRVKIKGRASHAGLAPDRGISATVELAHQILAIQAISDPAAGTTVTPTRALADTTTNTVAASAECFVDVRVQTEAEQRRVDQALRALQPTLPEARLTVQGRRPRPPMTADVSSRLFDRAQQLAHRLGLPTLIGTSVGGASDANLTAATGTPTLDGLGAAGSGAHGDDEHVLLDSLPGRTALTSLLITDILDSPSK